MGLRPGSLYIHIGIATFNTLTTVGFAIAQVLDPVANCVCVFHAGSCTVLPV